MLLGDNICKIWRLWHKTKSKACTAKQKTHHKAIKHINTLSCSNTSTTTGPNTPQYIVDIFWEELF